MDHKDLTNRFDRLEVKIDELSCKLDTYMLNTEKRVTTLENRVGPLCWGIGVVFISLIGALVKGCINV